MKKIYFIETFTGTFLSRLIKIYTNNNYSHISISLDKDLNKMYSFGRLHAYNPIIAGFVHESPKSGTFKRFKNTYSEIYELEITDEQYKKIEYHIKEIEKNKKMYKFNLFGLFATSINMKIKQPYSFYCAEFVKHILEKSDINVNLPEIVKPEHFTNITNVKKIYQGYLREYEC